MIPFFDYQADISESLTVIINQLRLPRILLAGIVGFSIALSGATFQSIFKNPLADPYLIGAASGSALGATIVLMLIGPIILMQISILPLASFLGGVIAVGAQAESGIGGTLRAHVRSSIPSVEYLLDDLLEEIDV